MKNTQNIRIWSYNTERHILNVHFVDGSQSHISVSTSRMKGVFSIRRENNNSDNSPAVHEELNKIIAEHNAQIVERELDERKFDEREDALEERFWYLHTKREVSSSALPDKEEEEYRHLLNRASY